NARIGATYLRIGSRHSGFVDNVASGGLVTEVDRSTRRFAGAFALSSGRLTPFSTHPDTGTPIVGAIPHWQHVLTVVKQIAEDIEHLEYFGFDVAVTPNGIMIPEINRFPDYPRIAPMPTELIDYLLGQLVLKKAKYGYDIQRPSTLISLPRPRRSFHCYCGPRQCYQGPYTHYLSAPLRLTTTRCSSSAECQMRSPLTSVSSSRSSRDSITRSRSEP